MVLKTIADSQNSVGQSTNTTAKSSSKKATPKAVKPMESSLGAKASINKAKNYTVQGDPPKITKLEPVKTPT